jgi:antitoxin (DNA-binding transcriptional repressor) of toxin-antitoxin stability system
MTNVGIRELERQLGRYLKRVSAGERLLVTERGKPVAVISAPPASTAERHIEAMLRAGVARWAGGKPRGARRAPRVRGKPVAAAVIEDRGGGCT